MKCKKGSKPENPIRAMVIGDTIVYGKVEGLAFRVFELDMKGTPRATEERMHYNADELREVTWWRRGCVGVAEATFPDPQR